MKIKGLTLEQLHECARQAGGMELCNVRREGNYFLFTLRPTHDQNREKWRLIRRSYEGNPRRANAICFHGHKQFMLNVFAFNPNAIIRSAKAAFLGREDFGPKADAIEQQNIGSMMNPLYYGDACACTGDVAVSNVVRLATMPTITTLKQSDVLKCPYVIIMPQHYRSDGTCRCNDPAHKEMKEWGYRWYAGERRWRG